MPVFSYQAIDKRGHRLSGQMPADDEMHLEEKLKVTQLWLLEAALLKSPSAAEKAAAQSPSSFFSQSIKRRDLIEFCTIMAFQARVGLPLLQSLEVASQDCENVSIDRKSVVSGKSV